MIFICVIDWHTLVAIEASADVDFFTSNYDYPLACKNQHTQFNVAVNLTDTVVILP